MWGKVVATVSSQFELAVGLLEGKAHDEKNARRGYRLSPFAGGGGLFLGLLFFAGLGI